MTRLVRIELLKLTTVRLSYWLLATAALLTAFFCTLEAARSGVGKSVAPLSTYSGLSTIVTGGVWGLLFAAVLGATAASGEFRHQTATLTYLATPDRNRVLVAKSIAAALAGAVFGLVAYFVAAAFGLGFVAAHGYHVSIGAVTFIRFGAGHIVAGALLGAVGAALGSLIRSQLAAVIGASLSGPSRVCRSSAACSPRSGRTCPIPTRPPWPAPSSVTPGSGRRTT